MMHGQKTIRSVISYETQFVPRSKRFLPRL
jgi:hypothetical protein